MTHIHRQRLRRQRQKREGAALLIVLLVLLMATGTAMFTVQSTQFEVRAAGSLHQAMRAKYVAEAATVSVLALCYQTAGVGCTDHKRSLDNISSTLRQQYALPNYVGGSGSEALYSLTLSDFDHNPHFAKPPLPTDKVISGGIAAPYTPTFDTFIEKWDVPNPGEQRPRFRLVVSTYGALNYDANADGTTDDVKGTGEQRYAHQTISATRAFFDLK